MCVSADMRYSSNINIGKKGQVFMGQLDSKVAIVTGSDSGIGRAIAIQLAQEGATVVVNYAHAQAKAEEVLHTIEKNNGKALVVQADVSQYQQVVGLIQ